MSAPVGKYMTKDIPLGDPVEEIEEKHIKLPGDRGVKVLTRQTLTYPGGRRVVTESSRIEMPK